MSKVEKCCGPIRYSILFIYFTVDFRFFLMSGGLDQTNVLMQDNKDDLNMNQKRLH